MEEAGKLAAIPQYHFVGKEDKVVLAFIVENFAGRSAGGACIHIEEVPGADHAKGWAEAWPRLLTLPMDCSE